jgi:hypothetical protein
VPLVCSRWHEMMADASMWPVVDVTPRIYGMYHTSNQQTIINMGVWLQRRSAGMRELTLRASAQCCSCHCMKLRCCTADLWSISLTP